MRFEPFIIREGEVTPERIQKLKEALNRQAKCGYTHFAMTHTDIQTGEGWLDTLLDEMDRVDADQIRYIR